MMIDLAELYRKTQLAQGDAYADQWRDVARADIKHLARWIQRVPIEPTCSLFEIYEGVSKCDPIPSEFFIEELTRLIALATATPNNRAIYSQLEAFALLDRHPPGPLQAEILRILEESLKSPVPQVRRVAAYLLGDFLRPSNIPLHRELRRLVSADPDWRVRYLSFCSLKDLHLDFPTPERPPRLRGLDRLRVLVFGTLRANELAA